MEKRQKILTAMLDYPDGGVITEILKSARVRCDSIGKGALNSLVTSDVIVPVFIKKNGRKYQGYKLSEVSA